MSLRGQAPRQQQKAGDGKGGNFPRQWREKQQHQTHYRQKCLAELKAVKCDGRSVTAEFSMAGLLFFATLQGGGFGILWPFANRRVVEAALPHERDLAASAFSTLQRMGYAVGSATAGIIANANGFSGGFTKTAATTAAPPLFLYFIPIALLGCVAAFRLTKAMPAASGR